MSYSKELEFAKALAYEAGDMIKQSLGLETMADWKQDETPVTVTDTAVNDMVIQRVRETFPDDGILGEEAGYETGRGRLWVVDPIDGTYAFTLGAPLSTFLLALVIGGQPVLGVIYDPYLNRMYWAVRGSGAHLNDTLIHVSKSSTLNRCFVVLSTRQIAQYKSAGQLFDNLGKQGAVPFNFRSFGYGSAYVAAGTAVGAVIGKGHPWDVAATKIIVEEAGGKVTDLEGNERRYDGPGNAILASNGILHDELLKLITE